MVQVQGRRAPAPGSRLASKSRKLPIFTPAESDRNRSVALSAADPYQWLVIAERLKRSADLVWGEHASDTQRLFGKIGTGTRWSEEEASIPWPISPVYMLLAGLALENLAKGILVGENPQLVEEGGLSSRVTTGHLSPGLLGRAGVGLNQHERDLVERLAVFVVWGGRYPVPKYFSGLWPTPYPMGGIGPKTYILHDDRAAFDALFARLVAEVRVQATAHKQRAAAERADRRVELEGIIRTQGVDEDGLRVVERKGPLAPEEAAVDGLNTAIACVACQVQFTLSIRRWLALCRCGTISRVVVDYHRRPPSIRTVGY
jgi:hypothetical protein